MTVAPAVEEVVRVRLAGAAMSVAASSPRLGALVARPFSHLARAAGEPDLRVEAWTGTPGTPTGPDRIELSADGAVVTHVRPDAGAVLDRRTGLLRAWWADEDAVPPWERTKPFLLCLALWLADRGLTVAHAGCVARDGRAVLLVGPSGSGKSTVSLACAASGFAFLGDDQVAVELREGRPFAHSLYGTARLDGEHLAANPELACGGPVVESGEPKPVLVIGESTATLVSAAEVAAIAIVGQGPEAVRPVPRAAALRALAPSSLARMPLGPPAFALLAAVAAAVPAVAIDAPEPGALPGLVGRLLAGRR